MNSSAYALDVVIVNVGESDKDQRIGFKNELVEMALEITKDQYGDYKIVENTTRMNISRAFRELEKGDDLTLTFAHTRREFEQRAHAIKVPLRRGIDSYRLLMVRKGQAGEFADVSSLRELRQFSVGLSPYWSTYAIMQQNDFSIVDTPQYSTMFKMLELERFDFIPRALNEVYSELESHTPEKQGIEIVPNLVLYIPSASYMFVSRKQPRLYERLNAGLHALSVNGELTKLTDEYYMSFVKRAEIQNRTIITIEHDELPTFTPHQPIIEKCICND